MDLGETIRKQVQEAVEAALKASPKNVASATSVSSSGHSVSVYVDDEVTIVERDGKRRVIRHDDEDDASGPEGGEPPAAAQD